MSIVDHYIDALPADQQQLVIRLRQLILRTIPGVEEKFSFKIPFYHYHGMFCYINPAKEGIELGLCRGKDLIEAFPQLEQKGRAIVATLSIKHSTDFKKLEIGPLIAAAALWNEEAKKKKIPMVKKAGKNNPIDK